MKVMRRYRSRAARRQARHQHRGQSLEYVTSESEVTFSFGSFQKLNPLARVEE